MGERLGMARRTVVRLLACLLVSFCVPGQAHADSDGYYCTGPGYLAYQFGMAPKSPVPHRLFVISTGGPAGIPEPVSLELPQFQVHGLVCGQGWVDVASFTTVYRVELDAAHRPVRYAVQGVLDRPIPEIFLRSQRQNLGTLGGERAFRDPIRRRLVAKAGGGEYMLDVAAQPIGSLNRCELAITSRIVETDSSGREISQRVIFQGRGSRECGGG